MENISSGSAHRICVLEVVKVIYLGLSAELGNVVIISQVVMIWMA